MLSSQLFTFLLHVKCVCVCLCEGGEWSNHDLLVHQCKLMNGPKDLCKQRAFVMPFEMNEAVRCSCPAGPSGEPCVGPHVAQQICPTIFWPHYRM